MIEKELEQWIATTSLIAQEMNTITFEMSSLTLGFCHGDIHLQKGSSCLPD